MASATWQVITNAERGSVLNQLLAPELKIISFTDNVSDYMRINSFFL